MAAIKTQLLVAALGAACLVAAAPAFAQVEAVTTPPRNLIIGNYDTVPVGPFGGLEGNAYAARVGDPSAAWYNPAGLARQDTAQISGSAGVYQTTTLTPTALPSVSGGSLQQLPNFVGFTFSPKPRLTIGAAVLTTTSWNQETDSELATPAASGQQQRFAYSANSEFSRRVLAVSAGYRGAGAWRYGGGFAVSLTEIGLVQGVSDRLATATGLQSLLVAARASGTAIQLRSQAGVQYDRSKWRFGAAIRTPGPTLHRSGAVTLDGFVDSGTESLGASVFDPEAAFKYHLPWEFQGGAAWVHDRVEVELDLQAYSSIAAYPLLATDEPARIYADAGGGQPPTVASRPFPAFTTASDGVVNVSAGGHLRVFKSRDLRVHGSVGNNTSPVGGQDTVFNRVNLATWTVGASGTFGKFQFSAGFNHQSGVADEITLRNLLNGRVVRTALDVTMSGFIYALAYEF